jgi:hypothetical protein
MAARREACFRDFIPALWRESRTLCATERIIREFKMAQLYDAESGALIGTITARELQFLFDQLEEEGVEDQDYYIDRTTLEWFEEHGADLNLTVLLREALSGREGMDIRWAKD